MQSLIIILCLLQGLDYTICLEAEKEDNRCDALMKRSDSDDRGTVTDNTPARLHETWVSQECEVRTGPKYVIRKYNFFKNDTFLLLQYHYAEESCSIATYTIIARGSIKIVSPSATVPGAAETYVQLDSVHLIPLNRQVAHKFGRRMNTSCGWDKKWRPYVSQLIYERDSSLNTDLNAHDLNSNSLQSRLSRAKRRHTLQCLESFDVDLTELELLRIEVKRFNSPTNSSTPGRERIELLLGGLARSINSQRMQPSRLQSTPLLRADTQAMDCPICGNVYRATECSPPLFHQAPSLPAVIDGLWLSVRCESVDGGLWSKRFFQMYSRDNRWFARWTYYTDSTCSNVLYMTSATGTYVQRALETDIYRHVPGDTEESIMLRVNRRQRMKLDQDPFQAQQNAKIPSGTSELELRVLDGLLVPISRIVPSGCKVTNRAKGIMRIRRIERDLKNCMPKDIETPATIKFKAKISLNWKGDYTLLLAAWRDDPWEAPLYRCSETATRTYFQELLYGNSFFPRERSSRYNQFNRFRRHWFSTSLAVRFTGFSFTIYLTISCFLHWLNFVY
ncbi:protein APCDD1-like isoform X2 [Ceratina calcarata]|uniref:Protein APCDD1-like isoform X2 n=1 Tax=Ceratina calcarata TaxID=156304 RepID=A0AAJ7WCP2_9HYME|nr:protein APCDD1-like isoform X2 [Ceratina calcarata]